MKITKCTAPINIELLKDYFTDKDQNFVIDYTNSTLKGGKLLVYLSNLDLPSDIEFGSYEEQCELLKEYLSSNSLLKIHSLEIATLVVLFQMVGFEENTELSKKFIEENKEILEVWLDRICSLTLYNMYTIEDADTKKWVESFEHCERDGTEGINFVSLLKYEPTYSLFQITTPQRVKFYSELFTQYMFKGKNLFHYWANENNPLFLLTQSIAQKEKV